MLYEKDKCYIQIHDSRNKSPCYGRAKPVELATRQPHASHIATLNYLILPEQIPQKYLQNSETQVELQRWMIIFCSSKIHRSSYSETQADLQQCTNESLELINEHHHHLLL